MKIRMGFVSNSSSSSYVVLIPDDFDIDDLVFSRLDDVKKIYKKTLPWGYRKNNKVFIPFDYPDTLIKNIKNAIIKKRLEQYEEEFWIMHNVVLYLMSDLIIARSEGGPDEGRITFIEEGDIKNKIKSLKDRKKMSEEEKNILKDKIKKEKSEWEKKQEEMKIKMKHIDPFGEEEWDD